MKLFVRKNTAYYIILIALLFIISCGKEKAVEPIVTPPTPTNTAPTANFTVSPSTGDVNTVFTFNASTCSDAQTAASALQVRWDLNGDGTFDTNWSTTKTESGNFSSAGTYTAKLEVKDAGGLIGSTTKTLVVDAVSSGEIFTDSRDGSVYNIITVGNITWMDDNLRYEIPGKQITDASAWNNNSTNDAWTYYNNDKDTYRDVYGILYQFEAALAAIPDGWRLPTELEINALTESLGGISVAGGKLKEEGTSHWTAPNTGATNSSGFTALPGGLRYDDGTFQDVGNYAAFWTSTVYTGLDAWFWLLSYDDATLVGTSFSKKSGFSIRAVKDENNNTSPTASFTIDPTSGDTSTDFAFDASASSDTETATANLQVRWDFDDDGTFDVDWNTTKTTTHTYTAAATYNVKVEVKDEGGLVSSETKVIIVITPEHEGISEAYVDLDKVNGTIDSYDIEAGTTTISFSGAVPDIVEGTILTIDMDTMGYLRKVVSSQVNGNTLTVETEQAFFTDIFVDKDFNLDTELMEPYIVLKSSSTNKEISEALTDPKGFIHPIEIIYHKNNGQIIKKSALNLKSGSEGSYDIIKLSYNFSKTDLYGKQGDDIHFYIDEGKVVFIATAKFEFDFDFNGEYTDVTNVRKGEFKSFKFYLDSQADFIAKLALDMQASDSKEDTKKLFDMNKVTAKFVVAGVPVWISFDCDIYGKYSFNASASAHADWGFESKHKVLAGGTYYKENDQFIPITEYDPVNTLYPLNINGEINLGARFEIYPRVEVMFYDFYGPLVEIAPYIKGEYKATLQNQITSSGTESFLAWNSSLDLGLDFRIGSKLTFLWGYGGYEFGPTTFNLFNTTLWRAPYKIKLLTEGLPSKAEVNSIHDIKLKVIDLFGNALPNCPLYFSGNDTLNDELLFTDNSGELVFNWTLNSVAKQNNLKIVLYKADKSIIDEMNLGILGELKKELPIVSTTEVTNIGEESAVSGGNVTSNGNVTVTERGVCWSTTTTPTIDDSKTSDGTGIGSFTSNITGLTASTTYYVRAYATNSQGTAYGEQKQFSSSVLIVTLPSITTSDVNSITVTTATSGGNVTSDGNATVTERGVCWSTTATPTINDSKSSDGSGTGSFTSNITGLTASTAYYLRAYATNSEGTSYGSQKQFTASDIIVTFTDSRDGHSYEMKEFGSQVWMVENLKYLPSVVGPGLTFSDSRDYYVYDYDGTDVAAAKATENYTTYGVLYNWLAAMNSAASTASNPSGVQGACPSGWHLPSVSEWTELTDYLEDKGYGYEGSGSDIAKSMASPSGWFEHIILGLVGTDQENNNSSGFTGLPTGVRELSGEFYGFVESDGKIVAYGSSWWSSTEDEYAPYSYFSVGLVWDSADVGRWAGGGGSGKPVRCVKDD